MMKNVDIILIGILLIIISALSVVMSKAVLNDNDKIYNQITQMTEEVKTLKEIIQSDYQEITVTSYHPKSKGINSDEYPNKTATMKKPISGYTLAISTELVELGWLGKKIYINGWGVGHATDRMGASVKGKHIDVCAPSLKVAKKFGIKRNVLAIVLR